MRESVTLEAWVYPTSDANSEYHIAAKHTYWDGGYTFQLRKVNGTLRAAFMTNMTGGAPTWPDWDGADCNGLRGAYSSAALPLNEWSHVAITYDATGPDRSPDPSVGRIRVYVNGDDVTWSDPQEGDCYAQPGPGEDVMFPYSDHSPDNETICYNEHWCASALSVAGVNWSSPSTNFVGRLDEFKLWNVTKPASYFEPIDAQVAPTIQRVRAEGSKLYVRFSEETYSQPNATGNLEPSDFVLTDVGSDNAKTITAVDHVAGDTTCTITLDSALIAADFGVDTLAAASSAIYDEVGTTAPTTAEVIEGTPCPTGDVTFNLNESAGATTVADASGAIVGAVTTAGSPDAMGGGVFTGDGTSNYITFSDNDECLQAEESMTIEARLRPRNIPNDTSTSYIRRVLAHDQGGNYQVSVWRNPSWSTYNPPAGVASVALWVKPVDTNGGNGWKLALTDYDSYPIQSDHWYSVRAEWDSSRAGSIPARIYVDDEGTDGSGTGEVWSGYLDATDVDQSQVQTASRLFEGDVISATAADTAIGRNVNNPSNNLFDGEIDWITWSGDGNPDPFGISALRRGLGLDPARGGIGLAQSPPGGARVLDSVLPVEGMPAPPGAAADGLGAPAVRSSSLAALQQEAAYATALQATAQRRSAGGEVDSGTSRSSAPAVILILVGLAFLLGSLRPTRE
jgi:hypothetical protein